MRPDAHTAIVEAPHIGRYRHHQICDRAIRNGSMGQKRAGANFLSTTA
jgi:hypothetical protein